MSALPPAKHQVTSTLLCIFLASAVSGQAQDNPPADSETANEDNTEEGRVTHPFSREWLIDRARGFGLLQRHGAVGEEPAELRVTLVDNGQKWRETWLYRWTR